MVQYNFLLSDEEGLKVILQSYVLRSASAYKSQFVQIYSARCDCEWFRYLGDSIKVLFPDAVIVGASSVGEVLEGEIHTNTTVILFSFFEDASLHLISHECPAGGEEEAGARLKTEIEETRVDKKGVFILSTPISHDSGKIFAVMMEQGHGCPVFGGGAGYYANLGSTVIFDGDRCYNSGIISVIFSGERLFIEVFTSLGWYPLSREMTITGADNVTVTTIDDKPAFSVYKKYLGIKSDDNFFQNSLEFPFLLYKDGQAIARTPFLASDEDGTIRFLSDVHAGDKCRIAYGDPRTILAESAELQKKMNDFRPEAIFLFTCICRRFLMQQDVDLETRPFNKIAPTAGFYTFGEFYSDGIFSSLLNSSMVAVGFREGPFAESLPHKEPSLTELTELNKDPFANQHSRILSRLLYFINILTNELEDQNRELKTLIELKNELLGVAAHDLRNPTGVIHGFSGLLKERGDEESKYFADIILGESAKMLQLINDLLDISRIEAGKLDLRLREKDYISFVRKNIRMNEFLSGKKGIKIISDFVPEELTFSFDSGKIDQVLNNLISNAVKYSYPDTAIEIKVHVEDGYILTQVIDHGQGIPESEVADIFRPFKRSSVKPTSGETSHGLGLAIVKKIIEGHGGEVGVISQSGSGSVFYFTLPLRS